VAQLQPPKRFNQCALGGDAFEYDGREIILNALTIHYGDRIQAVS
jgi:hypothetical protein